MNYRIGTLAEDCWIVQMEQGATALFSDELVSFLKNSFPVQLDEISAAVDLLTESLDAAAETVTSKGNELLADKEYEDAISLINKAKELDGLSKKVQKYADTFQIEDVALISEDEALDDIEKTLPNYSYFEVDNTGVHTLHENFVHKRPYAFELKGKKVFVTEWKRMLIETCNILADINIDLIGKFPDNRKFNGKKTKYFTTSDPGSMRSPHKLERLDMYVETNFSANFIRNLIIKMINHYKIPLSDYKIYLRADYTGLHKKIDLNDTITSKEQAQKVEVEQKKQVHAVTDITWGCIQQVSSHLNIPLTQRSQARYQSDDRKTTVICLVSSGRDSGKRTEYWFGLRVKQKAMLDNSENSYIALGCGSESKILLIPYSRFKKWLNDMSISYSTEEISHWNITVIKSQGNFTLRLRVGRQNVNLAEYILLPGNSSHE